MSEPEEVESPVDLPFGEAAGYFLIPEEYRRLQEVEERLREARSLLRRTVGLIDYQGRYPGRLSQLADDIDLFLEN